MPGVCVEKQLEPSHALLDLVSQQFEARQLAYLSPDRCTSREWEVAMGKTSKQIQLDTDHLVVKEKSDTPDQVAATEMQIYEALRDAFADLLDWTVHERYISPIVWTPSQRSSTRLCVRTGQCGQRSLKTKCLGQA